MTITILKVNNCILGSINVKVNILQRSEEGENINYFCRTDVNFLVANKQVKLDRILLGSLFLTKHGINLLYSKHCCKVLGMLRLKKEIKKLNYLRTLEIKQA